MAGAELGICGRTQAFRVDAFVCASEEAATKNSVKIGGIAGVLNRR